jgi:hypothetical protein
MSEQKNRVGEVATGLDAKQKEAQRRANLEQRNFCIWVSAHDMYRVQPEDFEDQPVGWTKLETVQPQPRPRPVAK